MTNNENEIFIEGEYNYNENVINMILDLSQNGETRPSCSLRLVESFRGASLRRFASRQFPI